MSKKRGIYLVVITVTIMLGLLVRLKKAWFPDVVNAYLGDVLYAFMMFYIVSFIAPDKKPEYKGGVALLVCYCIELGQLYRADWINAVRATLPGRLILGSGFLWSDLLAYFIGVCAAYAVHKLCFGYIR